MRVTFLAHSGFLVELERCALVFDWWNGTLPSGEAPLVCFASHAHSDHFDPRIFALDDGARPVAFVLSKDIRLTERNVKKWGLGPETREKVVSVPANADVTLPPPFDGVRVETLRSTDVGVAFLVTAEGKTLYHAGDLNWWHWEGEAPAANREMEAGFKRSLEALRARHIDLAFVPLDPRLGDAAGWGLSYLLKTAEVRRVFPMHQWDDYSATGTFLSENPACGSVIVPVERPGQSWELPD